MTIDTIVTDLDDTLLSETGEISEWTLKVLQRCLEKGIRVIPASGRAQASIEPFVRQLNTGLPYIACNGSQLINVDHTLIEQLCLPVALGQEICRYFQERNCFAQIYRDNYIYYDTECDASLAYKTSSGLTGFTVGDISAFLTFETPKILCISDTERIEVMYPDLQKRFAGRAIFTISKPTYIEITHPQAHKGAALQRLAAHIGIDPQKTFVFGDSLNDLTLMAFTENSVAMGNGREEVKRAAHYICPPNSEDGLARFVLEHILCESL